MNVFIFWVRSKLSINDWTKPLYLSLNVILCTKISKKSVQNNSIVRTDAYVRVRICTDVYGINWLFLKVFLYIHLDPRILFLLFFPFLRNCSFCKYEFIIGHIEELHNFSPLFIQVFEMIHFCQWRGRIKRKLKNDSPKNDSSSL